MQIRSGEFFNTVRTEGSILPPDLLRRIRDGDKSLEGLSPRDYGLSEGETIGQVVNRAWNSLVGTWWSFQSALQKLPSADPATSLTRERWLLPLFGALGFDRLTPTKAIEIDGKAYAVSHIWHNTPIHLVGFHIDPDKRTPGVAGAARSSPHSLLQQLLNQSPQYLWGIVSNGRYLRILRDNVSLTRQAFVEFDLEAMMAGEVYSDFILFWLLIHSSRFRSDRPEQCLLEKWSQAANAQGTRALDQLRSGVESAILALGRGFVGHPHNGRLVDDLASGRLTAQDYYRQLLRLVYRLIFLFVAEDRGLLLEPHAEGAAKDRYLRYYSVGRLRRLAPQKAGGNHVDLYEGLSVVAEQLGTEAGCHGLALPGLGSFLWSKEATPALNGSDLTNRDLLAAVAALAFTSMGKVRRSVDYKNLGSEELGSVYESLLELHPQVDVDARSFALTAGSGHERKTTGSYYTPSSLIASLLDTALEPIIAKAASQADPERSLLGLKVVDPASGSGHFLIAAAHRIAKRVASARTGDEEPSPAAMRAALRDVIGHCIFGVDVNEMAVELCKVSLWMEALDPGLPLSFLDHHIVCGNSLLGVTPVLLEGGIPEDAFEVIKGDDKAVVMALKKQNRQELAGQTALDLSEDLAKLQRPLSSEFHQIEAIADLSPRDVREKETRYTRLIESTAAADARLVADAWCAAFVVPKTVDSVAPITEGVLRKIASHPGELANKTRHEIERMAGLFRFFHWHLVFPDVFQIPSAGKPTNAETGWSGGFDVVLSNPPWDKVKLQEKEWFASSQPAIAAAPKAARRRRMIDELETADPALHKSYLEAVRQSEGESHLIRNSGRYPLSGRGDVNTYAVFAEVMRSIVAPTGRMGAVLPTGIATDDTTKHFFAKLVSERSLVSLYDFENKLGLFPAVHSAMKFCLLTLTGRAATSAAGADFVFFAHTVADLQEEERRIRLLPEDFALLNPNTLTCPVFRTKRDAELAKSVYGRVPILVNKNTPHPSAWEASFITMFHMTNDSHLFRTIDELKRDGWTLDGNVFRRAGQSYEPLYEAKVIAPYDHRAADVVTSQTAVIRQGQPKALSLAEHQDDARFVQPRYWVPASEVMARLSGQPPDWLSCFANVTSPTNERTVVAAIIPPVGVGNSAPLLATAGRYRLISPLLVANLSSFVLDFLARFKVGGINLNFFIVEQFPILPPSTYLDKTIWSPGSSLKDWMIPRVVELAYTSWDLLGLAEGMGYKGAPFQWNEERRRILQAELDAAFFHLYAISREDVEYVLESFPIVKRRDEQAFGEFRTKLQILDRYEAMDRATHSGQAYQTPLDPPPADPQARHAASRSRLEAAR